MSAVIQRKPHNFAYIFAL